MRVVSHAPILGVDASGEGAARQRRTQYARLTKIKKRLPKVQFYKKYGAIMSKIAKAGLMPSGLHGVRCMGMPPTRLKAFRTTVGRYLPGKHAGRSLTWRLAMHECDPTHTCRVEPIVARAETVWDEQLDDADLHRAWRRQQRLVGLKPLVDTASPHDLRHCKWTQGGLATDLPQGHEGASACGQRAGVVERMGGQRRAEGAPLMPIAGTCGTGEQTSSTSTA